MYIIVVLPDDATGNVTAIIDGNASITVSVVNGTAVVSLGNLTAGNHTIEILYSGDKIYEPTNQTVNVAVDKAEPEVDIPENVILGEDIVIGLPEDATGNVTAIIDGNASITVPVVNGTAVIPMDNITTGNHTIEILYSGDENYESTNQTVNVTVSQTTPDIEITSDGNDLIINYLKMQKEMSL